MPDVLQVDLDAHKQTFAAKAAESAKHQEQVAGSTIQSNGRQAVELAQQIARLEEEVNLCEPSTCANLTTNCSARR